MPYKIWNGNELEFEKFSEYLEKDYEIMNKQIFKNITKLGVLGKGSYGVVNILDLI